MQLINDMSETDKIEHYVMGLQPAIANQVELKDPRSLQEAMTWAQRTELLLRNHRHTSGSNYNNYSGFNRFPSANRAAFGGGTTTSAAASSSASAPMELGNISTAEVNEDQYDEEYEKYLQEGDEYESNEYLAAVNEVNAAVNESGEEETEEQLQAMQSNGRPFNRQPSNRVPNLNREEFKRLMKEGKCLRCKKPGHIARNCPQQPKPRRNF